MQWLVQNKSIKTVEKGWWCKTFLIRHVITWRIKKITWVTQDHVIKGSCHFVCGDSFLQVINLSSLIAIGLVEENIERVSFVMWSQVTTWLKGYVTLWLDMWLLIISHPSVDFYSQRLRESEFITFFKCHMTLCEHVIKRLSDVVNNRPAIKPTTLSSLIVTGLAEGQI